jgi:hypothetical protein
MNAWWRERAAANELAERAKLVELAVKEARFARALWDMWHERAKRTERSIMAEWTSRAERAMMTEWTSRTERAKQAERSARAELSQRRKLAERAEWATRSASDVLEVWAQDTLDVNALDRLAERLDRSASDARSASNALTMWVWDALDENVRKALDRLAERAKSAALITRAELLSRVRESTDRYEDLSLRISRVASKASQRWAWFGSFLPPHSRELLGHDLAEHTADLFAALMGAKTQREQNRLVRRFTLAAVVKVLDRTRVALQNRLADEFHWVARRVIQE